MRVESLDLTSVVVDRAFAQALTPTDASLRTCIQCGTCSASCPSAYAMDYSPRMLWRMIQLGLKDEVLNSRTFWLCTQCHACTVRCPRGIVTSEAMRKLREWAAAEGLEAPQAILRMRDAVAVQYNILGEDNAGRLIWSENLEEKPEQLAGKEEAEVLLYIGCVSAFFPMAYSIPQSLVQVLDKAGVDYTTLGGQEWCCGYPLYGAGMEEQIPELAQHNIQHVQELGVKTLVSTCPSCYHTWRHLYPQYVEGDYGFEILHASEYLAHLIEEERIKLGEMEMVVTYHDPCDLGRKSGVFDAPRFIIESIPGVTLVEMANTRENALCCGGGGDVAMAEADVSETIAERRLEQAVATEAKAIISACQQCKRTLQQAARQTKTRIRALDVTELVLRAMEAAE
jgi:heterodisulfide reductase subunit D